MLCNPRALLSKWTKGSSWPHSATPHTPEPQEGSLHAQAGPAPPGDHLCPAPWSQARVRPHRSRGGALPTSTVCWKGGSVSLFNLLGSPTRQPPPQVPKHR